jgi:phage N-6-adenine-methyltransferase
LDTSLHFSTGTDVWTTPDDLFKALDAEFHFTLDAAAEKHNRKVHSYLGPDHVDPNKRDALIVVWQGTVFCNPPYSRPLQGLFVEKAARMRLQGVTTVMLLPARTDTKVFHAAIWDVEKHQPRQGVEVRFLKGRLKFGGATNSAPFPSMVVVFRG